MKKKHILIVEDERIVSDDIKMSLQRFGYAVSGQAVSGEEGVEKAIKEKPALILMDVQLTDMDGLEATKKIRESEAEGNIPIVALTSYAMVGDREKALAAGCTGYIEKPINPDTFLTEIEKYLSR